MIFLIIGVLLYIGEIWGEGGRMMITNVGLLLAILLYFVLKFISICCILVIAGVIIGRIKAKGQETIKKWEGKENGER